MTILELIQKTTAYFEKAGVPNPRLDVELLLAHALKLKRMDLYLQFERVFTAPELDALRPLVKRRAAREPLQHLVGSVDFCGVTLAVSRAALVPRPETEVVAQVAIARLDAATPRTVLDLGTGSGAILLALLAARPKARGVGTDRDAAALALARANAETTGLAARVEFREGDLFAPVGEERFDLLVSNPPYIPSGEIANLQPEVREHDPRAALDGGPDGLDVLRRLAKDAAAHLNPGGTLVMEIGHDQSAAVEALLRETGWEMVAFHKDLQGIARIVEARRENAG